MPHEVILAVDLVRRNAHSCESLSFRSAYRMKSYTEIALNTFGISQTRMLKSLRSALTYPELTLPVHQDVIVHQPADRLRVASLHQKFLEFLHGISQRSWWFGTGIGHAGIIGEFDN